jgi:tyrosyl-tRNA synthetase
MKLSEELIKRGFVYQFSSENLGEILDGAPRTVYLGIDPTAEAIHVGNLVPYMLLNHLLKAGHKVILLIGGGTALIGDPSGRDKERDFVDMEEVQARANKMEQNIRALTVGDIKFVNNYDWLSKLSAVEFLRDVGKYFTVNSLIKKDAISARLNSENGISYTEFSYALLQSYDYYHLHKEYGVDLQIGGSDQWGNITGGIDYVRRTTGDLVYGLTMQLIVDKATGIKFGKSMGNAVWLDSKLTSPYELYQFWFNTADDSVLDYLNLFTMLPVEKIDEIVTAHQASPEKRIAQEILANEVITFVHGAEAAASAEKVTQVLFGKEDINNLTPEQLILIKENAPRTKSQSGESLIETIVKTELAESKREARMFIESGAIVVNETSITDVGYVLDKEKLGELIIVKRGKKKRALVEIE